MLKASWACQSQPTSAGPGRGQSPAGVGVGLSRRPLWPSTHQGTASATVCSLWLPPQPFARSQKYQAWPQRGHSPPSMMLYWEIKMELWLSLPGAQDQTLVSLCLRQILTNEMLKMIS